MIRETIAILAAYLLGAVPFGLLIARSRGVDIRQVGSRNIGATNVMRAVGKPWGILTFVLDALKGLVPTAFFPGWSGAPEGWLGIACAMAAILGHNFPVYLKFKGGKGVATSAGALLGLAPAAVGLGVVVWAAFFFTLRYVSLASIVASLVIPAAGWWLYRSDPLLPAFLTLLGALIILRHRANIQRLLNGTESRFGRKPEI